MKALKSAVREAQSREEIDDNVAAGKLTFELSSLVIGGYWTAQLLADDGAWDKSRALILERLKEHANDRIPGSVFKDQFSLRKYLHKLRH